VITLTLQRTIKAAIRRESVLATLEILADRHLTTRLRKLAKRIDAEVRAGKLHTMEEVFGKE
jgi:hypothetical protein